MTDTESMARAAALWSWCYRASPGQSMVAAAKLTDAELQECIDAAERLKGWAHLQQMVLRRQELTAEVAP